MRQAIAIQTLLNPTLSVQLRPALHLTCILLSKEHQNLITEVHYILVTTSLKFRARITKFQGNSPEALKHGISLFRLYLCTDHVKLAAAERISRARSTTCKQSFSIRPSLLILLVRMSEHTNSERPVAFEGKVQIDIHETL
jgi:hypothetical protein